MKIRVFAGLCLAASMITSCGNSKHPVPTPGPGTRAHDPALTLPKDLITYYSQDPNGPAEFRKFAQHLKWKATERERKCGKGNSCHGDPLALMEIDAPDGVNAVDFKKVDPNEQVLVGRLENIGDEEDYIYENWLPANKHTSGYIVLVGDSNGDVTPYLAVYSYKGKTKKLELFKGGPFKAPCIAGETHTPVDTADFKVCDTSAPGPDSIRPRDYTDALGWFSCVEGCCGSSFPPFSFEALGKPSADKAKKP